MKMKIEKKSRKWKVKYYSVFLLYLEKFTGCFEFREIVRICCLIYQCKFSILFWGKVKHIYLLQPHLLYTRYCRIGRQNIEVMILFKYLFGCLNDRDKLQIVCFIVLVAYMLSYTHYLNSAFFRLVIEEYMDFGLHCTVCVFGHCISNTPFNTLIISHKHSVKICWIRVSNP